MAQETHRCRFCDWEGATLDELKEHESLHNTHPEPKDETVQMSDLSDEELYRMLDENPDQEEFTVEDIKEYASCYNQYPEDSLDFPVE